MAQPTAYERSTSFANYQAANPSAPLPGAAIDAELNNIKSTLDALLSNIALIQRDDGDLGNETVGREQLKADISIGFNQPTAWATGTLYANLVDSVFFSGIFYRCTEDHTSGVFATDLAAGKWEEIADLTSVPLATAGQIEFSPTGDVTGLNVQDAIAELAIDQETDVASGTVTPIGGAKTSRVQITGTTAITAFDTVANRVRYVRFAAALTLTHGSSLALPANTNIVTEAGDMALFVSDALGAWRCFQYWRANDVPLSLVEQTVASASTADLGAARGRRVTITGTTTITSFGTAANRIVFGRFEGALTLTHDGTTLILPGGKNITTTAGDCFIAASDASGNWRVYAYVRANGHSLRVAYDTIASASTTELGSKHAEQISISGTTTITAFGSTAPTGARKDVRFEDALLLTHNGTSLILPAAGNITTAAGDTASFRHEGSGNWRCISYQRADGTSVRTMRGAPFAAQLIIKPASDSTVDIDAAYVILNDSTGRSVAHSAVDLTADITATGVINGVQTGRAVSTWFKVYVLSNGTAAGAYLVPHGEALSAPSGYTYSGFFGYVRTNASGSGNLLRTLQKGARAQYVVASGTTVTGLPKMASGIVGTVNTGPRDAVALGNYIAPTATHIQGAIARINAVSGYAIVAPNDQYDGVLSTTNPPPAICFSASSSIAMRFEFELESTNLYWASDNTNGALHVLGWTDSVNAT